MFLSRVLLLTAVAFPLLCHAEVKEVGDNGFTVSHTVNTAATPDESWAMMTGHIDSWWEAAHTWSGDSKNLYIRAEPGGCFCERLPAADGSQAGGVEHLRIIYLKPLHEIRFDGSLGPLQSMSLQGRMIWTVAPVEGGSAINFTYRVHGAMEGGFAGLASGVDEVIGLQLKHLAEQLAKAD